MRHRRRGAQHRIRTLFFQLDIRRIGGRAARAGRRHPCGLRVLALSPEGQRHLPVRDPDYAHAAPHRGHHPHIPDVPDFRAERHLLGDHPAIRRIQSAVLGVDDEKLL